MHNVFLHFQFVSKEKCPPICYPRLLLGILCHKTTQTSSYYLLYRHAAEYSRSNTFLLCSCRILRFSPRWYLFNCARPFTTRALEVDSISCACVIPPRKPSRWSFCIGDQVDHITADATQRVILRIRLFGHHIQLIFLEKITCCCWKVLLWGMMRRKMEKRQLPQPNVQPHT